MPGRDMFMQMETWFEAHVMGAQSLALFGFAMILVLTLLILGLLVGLTGSAIRMLRNILGARALKSNKSPGYRVMVAQPAGRGASRAGKWLSGALEAHLHTFTFGAPCMIAKTGAIKGGLSPKAIARARRRLAASDADMIVWAERIDRGPTGFEIHGLSRGGGLRPDEAAPFSFALPGKFAALHADMPLAASYFLARELQPALNNPQSFRPEKMKVLAEALETILNGCEALPDNLKSEVEAGFCASGVHIAEQAGDLSMLERVITMRRAHIQDDTDEPVGDRLLQARVDLGRALLARSEQRFDREAIEEAISHLAKVVDALRADPTIQRAQKASDAMFKAKSMLESRKRFAVNFGA